MKTVIKEVTKKLMSNKRQLVYLLLFLVGYTSFLMFWMNNRPGFLKVKSTPIQVAELSQKVDRMDRSISLIAKWTIKQDSLNKEDAIFKKRIPKIFPIPGSKITSIYGETRDSVKHWGLDISNKKGAPIYSPITGVVVSAKYDDGYGNTIIVDSGIFKVKIAHQDKLLVAVGQVVVQGQIIGTVGSTGYSTGPHEHIEIEQDGERRDPKVFLR